MSWSQFANLIREDNRDISAWKAAIEGNPNTPEGALEIAINHFIQNGDTAAIDDLCSFVVLLVNQAVEQNAHLTPGSRPVFCDFLEWQKQEAAEHGVHPTGLTVEQKEEVRQMIQSALDTGSA